MVIKKPSDVPGGEVTPQGVYLNRRNFMRAGMLALTTAATAQVYRALNPPVVPGSVQPPLPDFGPLEAPIATGSESPPDPAYRTNEAPTPLQDIAHYNNFYEFSTDKQAVAELAEKFVTRPWTVSVGGLVRKPRDFDLDDLLRISPPEERIYRMRCVEGWSMVIPWDGFSLSKLLERVEPSSDAKYVAFQTLHDPKRMPNQKRYVLDWPYVEGLRMDEAMHPLTILASGIYGGQLPPQDGAPVRLVVPWKYGFKGIKSIVKIDLVAAEPKTTWNRYTPSEYGFYANVNPEVDHPRWSQTTERRIGEFTRRKTLMFNGYGEQVAQLYAGMDLRANF